MVVVCPQMCVIAASMVTARRSNATVWLEVMEYFGGMTPHEMFHHFFVSPMRNYYLGGPDNWVFDKYIRIEKGFTVAHKRAQSGKPELQTANTFKGFVSYDLTDEQWLEFDKAFPKAFTSPTVWNDILTENKLTVTPKEGNYNACLWPQTGKNAGYGLSAFADSAFEAMAIVLFKYHLVVAEPWDQLVKSSRSKRG